MVKSKNFEAPLLFSFDVSVIANLLVITGTTKKNIQYFDSAWF
jgi:hypothetical protein